MSNAANVKQGNRVVYVKGDQQYSAISTNDAAGGYHPGTNVSSYFINLVYLNEVGNAVKVSGVPLVTAAADEDDKSVFAEIEWSARSRDYRESTLTSMEALKEELATKSVTIGWRPEVEAQASLPAGMVAVSIVDLLELSRRIQSEQPAFEICPDAVIPSACKLIDALVGEVEDGRSKLAAATAEKTPPEVPAGTDETVEAIFEQPVPVEEKPPAE